MYTKIKDEEEVDEELSEGEKILLAIERDPYQPVITSSEFINTYL